MSPRPGGEADKIGNRYERAWTVAQLLDVLAGRAEWVRVEPLGDLGKGVEFVLWRPGGASEAHQVKRQAGDANEWNVGGLTRLGIWGAAQRHSNAGRDYHFVSMVPFRMLQDLAERARNSNDLTSFIQGTLPRTLDALFSQVSDLCGGASSAYRVLRRFHVRLIDETELRRGNEVLAELLLEGGSGSQAAAALGQLVDDHIDAVLTAERLLHALRPFNVRRRLAVSRQGLADHVHAETAAWLARTGRQLIQPAIPRQEAERVRDLASASARVHFLVGPAGGGKTAVLQQAITGLVRDDVPTLVLRLDRYGALTSTVDLGRQLGLDVSPVTALAAASDGRPAVLVVDQLDAVSLASGRLPENFDVVADLVTEAVAVPNVHIILGCRQFDVDNDHRFRSLRDRLEATVTPLDALSDEQVEAAVTALGLPAAALTRHQREILRLPLHLSLLASVAGEPGALDFASGQRLFDAFWEHKRQAARQRRTSVRFQQVVDRLTSAISERQELAVPVAVLDVDDLGDDAAVLVSEQLLVRDGTKIAFFHEAVFDYAFARHWVNRSESLVGFLTGGEQELFRRGQVRQIMAHLREVHPGRFAEEVQALLMSERVRFHIKEAALSVLGSVKDPSSAEADVLLDVSRVHPHLQTRLWSRLRSPGWFHRLDADGHIVVWLKGTEEQRNRAVSLMAGAARTVPNRVAELLAEHCETPSYPASLRWVIRLADLGTNRRLFDLVVDGIRRGHYDDFEPELWMTLAELAKGHADRVIEALAAFLLDRPAGLELDALGRVAFLQRRADFSGNVISRAAMSAPRKFLETLLPYLLRVIEATAQNGDREGLRYDAQFSIRYPGSESNHDLDDVLFSSTAAAIREVAAADPTDTRPFLERLAADPHESAQWLLYQGLLGGGAAYAGWAAELLLQGRYRLLSGYASNGVWTTRQVLEAIGPHISDELFGRLEDEIRDLRFSWERGAQSWYAFNLLSALEERRLSEVGRRRLGELRRAFGMDQPPEPEGIVVSWVGPPIPRDAAPRMNDENWLQAIAKHAGAREDFKAFKGGAREQAHVLREQTKQDPYRFARLALRFGPDTNPAYGDAVLMGLGEAEPIPDESAVFDAVRHIASLGHTDNDRWLGSALRPYLRTAPLDVVELLRDHFGAAVDPGDEMPVWTTERAGRRISDLRMSGMNSARGALAEALADLLLYDVDGARTALVIPVLGDFALDPAVPVRACVARLIGAAMRHAKPVATQAFWRLIETDDALLATEAVTRLLLFLGGEQPAAIQPVIDRMLASVDEQVREAGGGLTAFAAMEWAATERLRDVLSGEDTAVRVGAADVAAQRLTHTANAELALTTLTTFMHDPSQEVREKAAGVADALRDRPLRPYERAVMELIESPTFEHAVTPLLHTLQHAPDRVDDLALLCAQRFVERMGTAAADIRTHAAADARTVGQIVIRGLAQTRTVNQRAALLDVIDQLILLDAYGVEDLIAASER
jgi:hypothetical protein